MPREYHQAYYAKNREHNIARAAKWKKDNPIRAKKTLAKCTLAWKIANPKRIAFSGQKNNAKKRGIEFLFTLDEWIDWWGDDFALRGRNPSDLCMARIGDQGAYEIGNVVKATCYDNTRNLI